MLLVYDRQIGYLDRVLARGRLAHAYLFYGPDAAGMLRVAKDIAKALVCSNYGGFASIVSEHICKECAAVDTDTHPAVILLDLEHSLTSEKEARKKIPIDDIHEIKRRFSFTPVAGAWRVAIINQVDTMSADAADAFLKLLEEPGAQTLFLLINDARESVAPTICSRAVAIAFSDTVGAPPDPTVMQEVRAAIAGGIPDMLVLSEKMAGDARARRAGTAAAVVMLRDRMRAAGMPAQRRALARRLARVLDIATVMETTNLNPRLGLDAIFLESASV